MEAAPIHRLMIVEDDPVVAGPLYEILVKGGYDVVGPCASGKEAIVLARKFFPALVLADIVLPGNPDGIAASQAIKDDLNIPILFICQNTPKKDMDRAKALGPLAFIYKPFTKEQVLSTIEIALDRRNLEDQLKENESDIRFFSLISIMNDGFLIRDRDSVIQFVNDRLCEMTGYSRIELVGRSWLDFIEEKFRPVLRKEAKARQKGSRSNYELTCIKKDGTRLDVIQSAAPIFQDNHAFLGAFAVITDITQIKNTERLLKKRKDELAKKTRELEEANLALRGMLKQSRKDKAELEKQIIDNMRLLIIPHLRKLKLGIPQKAIVAHLEKNLTEFLSPFARTLSSKLYHLSPTEIRVANLVRQGNSNKEIARVLDLSARTVEVHRTHIRKKLGLTQKKINLSSYLTTLKHKDETLLDIPA